MTSKPILTASQMQAELRSAANPTIAEHSARFFKTGPGEYGEGDQFLGLRVPILREASKRATKMPLSEVLSLLESEWHEERLTAVFVLVLLYQKGDDSIKKQVYEAYLNATHLVNNWDMVDSSAHKIVGPYLLNRDRNILNKLVKSDLLWERRIAIISTMFFIRKHQFSDTLELAHMLLGDSEDLMHKATGWALRELGKKAPDLLNGFLDEHYRIMPRTMLRYAIEKHPEPVRQAYLKGYR